MWSHDLDLEAQIFRKGRGEELRWMRMGKGGDLVGERWRQGEGR